MRRILTICFAFLSLCSVPLAALSADELLVTTRRDGHDVFPGDSICADEKDRCTLRAAVEEANAGPTDTIRLPAGKVILSRDLPSLLVTADLTIIGAGQTASRIFGSRRDRIFRTADGVSLSLQDLSLEKGALTAAKNDHGAAIQSDGPLTLTRVRLRNNKARDGSGGAIYATDSVSLFDSECLSNSASAGGCIYIAASGRLIVDGLLLRKNRAYFGGGAGIYVECGSSGHEIRRLTTVLNTTRKGFTRDTNTPFNPDGGAGGLNLCGDGLIENSTLFHDRCRRCGPGAIRVRGGNWLFDHILIKDNQAAFYTAGIYVDPDAVVQIRGTVFEGNDSISYDPVTSLHGGSCVGPLTSLGYNVERFTGTSSPSCNLTHPTDQTFISTARIYSNPKTRSAWTAWPQPGAVVIDLVGEGDCLLTVDELGRARPVDGDNDGIARCDAGPIEVQDSPTPTATPTRTVTPTRTETPTDTPTEKPTDTPAL